MFALLYFAQGSVLGYFTSLNALYLRSFNLTMSQIGIFSAIALSPMILKIFWGMLSDKVNLFGLGHRRPYIVIGLLMQAGGQLAFPFVNPASSFGLLTAIAFLSLLGMALYDTCTDGLALDITPAEERGKVQGIMVAGRAVGVVIISATVGLLSQLTNWTAVFGALAFMTVLPLPLVLLIREPARSAGRSFNWGAFRAFGKRNVIAVGLLGMISFMITGGTNQLVNPFLRENYGITYLLAGLYTAVWGIGVSLGGLTGGKLTDKIGHRRAVLGALFTALIAILLMAVVTGPSLAWPILLFFGLAYGYYEAVFFATSMVMTDIRIAASMFAILMALSNIGAGIGLALGGRLSDLIGYRWTFALFACLNLLVLPLVPAIFGKKRRIT
jgi:PAT family beta-lactamase induction signal transducer AmpG